MEFGRDFLKPEILRGKKATKKDKQLRQILD